MQHKSTRLPTAQPVSAHDHGATAARQALAARLEELGLAGRLTLSIPEAGRFLGLGETASYAAAARGEIPYRQFGKKKRVFVDALLSMAAANGEGVAS